MKLRNFIGPALCGCGAFLYITVFAVGCSKRTEHQQAQVERVGNYTSIKVYKVTVDQKNYIVVQRGYHIAIVEHKTP